MDVAAFVSTALVGLGIAAATKRSKEKRDAEIADLAEKAKEPLRHAYVPGKPESEVDFYKIRHLREFFPGLPTYESPIVTRTWPVNPNFTEESDYTLGAQPINFSAGAHDSGAPLSAAGPVRTGSLRRVPSSGSMDRGGAGLPEMDLLSPGGSCHLAPTELVAYATAGPSRRLAFDPSTVRVAVATCGGLCPGLNTVIREIVMCFTYVYGVPRGNIFGVSNGYRGFYSDDWKVLRPEDVSRIHSIGGTVLGSSRGGMDVVRILDSLIDKKIDIVILIGGDGTHRGADLLFTEACKRGVRLGVACVPKTIDNDIGIIDRSFGFQTAVEQAVRPIECAHTEAHSAKNGIGLVKLMGREAGFIALYASLASRDVNVCLIPEASWRLSKLLKYLEDRLDRSGHAVIVVAEGAESIEQKEAKARAAATPMKTDESGNRILDDVGEYLKCAINAHFKTVNKVCNLKYIDPSYIIRSSPANAADSDMCAQLAFNCVHGAMSGRTGFTVGTVDNVGVWLPVGAITSGKPRRVDVTSRIYARLCSSTGQPNLE